MQTPRQAVIGLLGGWLWLVVALTVGATEPAPVDESFAARSWQAEDGLPENRVVGVVQAPDGYLWTATQNGLVRFDGVRFQRVDLAGAPGQIAGTMRALVIDRAGRIWLAKEEGGVIFCFDRGQVRRITPDEGLPKNDTQRSMAVDGEGSLWVSYSSGKVARYKADAKVELYTTTNGLPGGGGIPWLITDKEGTLWFAKAGQVGVFRKGKFVVLENFGSGAVRIAAARGSGVWVCNGSQLFKFEEGVETVEVGKIFIGDVRDRSGFEPAVLHEDRGGAVWVGTASAGLFRYASNSVSRVEVSNPAILCLLEDREANLWVGTRGGGLNRVRRRMTSLVKPGLSFEGVQSVCRDNSGMLWVVGDNGVLARGRGTNWAVQSISSNQPQPYVTCVATGTNGTVWIGRSGGVLMRWDKGQFQDMGLRAALKGRSVRSLLVATNGDLWIGADAPAAICRLRGSDLHTFELPAGRRFVRAMTEDAAGNIWAGASDGLLVRITGEELVDETAKSVGLSIRCLHTTPKGDLWIGYAGAGVGRLRDGQTTRFSTEQGLLNDYVSQIMSDDRGNIWFAGNQGIFQVRERDFDDVVNGVGTRVWPVAYGRSEAIPGLQASFDFCPSSTRSADNRLYFSMLSGLAEVRLDLARLNYMPPNVFIERVAGDEHTFALYQSVTTQTISNSVPAMELSGPRVRRELRLPPGLQQVQFEFTALSFVAPENVQFRYRLEGLDENWVEAGTKRVASYTHPPPGKYRFSVTACNNDGIWNKIGDTLDVTFAPFFWETVWFRSLVATAAVGLACGSVVWIVRRRHQREVERLERARAVELERTRIARDLHDDLGVGLTEIGLLGDLAATDGKLPSASQERVQEITTRARTLAASLDEIVWAINPANDTSQSLADYLFPYAQKLLGRAGIRCRLELVEPLPSGNLSAEDRHEFFHAYKEALNNIIRHSGATQVEVEFSAEGEQLLLCITDNGSGVGEGSPKGLHHGIGGMRERLHRLGGRCDVAKADGGGTRVTFVLPVKSEK